MLGVNLLMLDLKWLISDLIDYDGTETDLYGT